MNTLSTPEFWIPFLWGLIILISWIGWGDLVRRVLFPNKNYVPADWALRAGWGMSATLAIGGWLALFHACNQIAVTLLVLVGATVAALSLYTRLRQKPTRLRLLARLRPRCTLYFLPLALLLLFLYATSVRTRDVNWWDDLPAYLVFSQRLLQTGTILDPFSWRRLSTYGGQQMFDAMTFSGATFFSVDILELGLAKIVFVGLLIGRVGRAARPWQRVVTLLLATLFVLIPVPRVNTQSQMTGVVLFLTLLRTLDLAGNRRPPFRAAILAGVVGAAVSTMRMNFVPAAVIGIALAFLIRALLAPARWKQQARALLLAGAGFTLALLPWTLVLYQSSRSLFYPLMRGTERPDFTFISAGLNTAEKIRWLADFCAQPICLVLLLPVLLAFARRYWKNELPLYAAALFTTAVTVLSFTRASYASLYRYSFPALFAVACALILSAATRGAGSAWGAGILPAGYSAKRLWPARLTAAFAWLIIAALTLLHAPAAARWLWQDRAALWSDDTTPLVQVAQAQRLYRDAQNAIPAGKPFLAAVSYPSLLDFSRNPIVSVDAPGAASPDPGMPLFAGGPAVKAYLKNLGIDYMMLVDENSDLTLFSRKAYTDTHDPEFDFTRRFSLQFLDDVKDLLGSEDLRFSSNSVRVIHLK